MYRRTDNLSESEPRMASDWSGFQGGQNFSVPLHDNDQQCRSITTGLVKIILAKNMLILSCQVLTQVCRMCRIRTTPLCGA